MEAKIYDILYNLLHGHYVCKGIDRADKYIYYQKYEYSITYLCWSHDMARLKISMRINNGAGIFNGTFKTEDQQQFWGCETRITQEFAEELECAMISIHNKQIQMKDLMDFLF